MSSSAVKAVILAGGSGSRLWPHSRQNFPKQFLNIGSEGESLLITTINRLSPYIKSDDILIVTNQEHASGEAYQQLSKYQTLLEPVARNTTAAIALAAVLLQEEGVAEDPVMVVLPADHLIQNVDAFHVALEKAIIAAEKGALVTFGLKPTRPDTGFGYIKASCSGVDVSGGVPVEAFVEKPDISTANDYLKEGCYFWNSGMFVWRSSRILAEIECHLPDVHVIIEEIRKRWRAGENKQESIAELFPSIPSISIDHGVLEKVVETDSRLLVFPCDIAWSDVGSWDAVYEILLKDQQDTVSVGNVLALDCHNTLIHSSHRLVTAIGVDDVCVVETPDAILVCKRGESQRVREVVNELQKRNAQEHIYHLTVRRPWGMYTVLEEQPGFKMKRITVDPGASLSLQRHQHRSEHWIVVAGTATVTCDDKVTTIMCNQSTYIPVGSKHRLDNRGKIPLQLVEVQVGEYLGEDDIERFDDVYGRISKD